MHKENRRGASALRALGCAALVQLSLAFGVPPEPAAASDSIFAVIDGETVTASDFEAFLIQFARSKFYHRVPGDDFAAVKADAAEALIKQRLLAHEAERRGVKGDAAAVDRQWAGYEARYKDSETWGEIQESQKLIRGALLERSKIAALEDQIRQVGDPGDEKLIDFYQANLELFTEPARAKLRVILIGVSPWENADAWNLAQQTADRLAAEIAAGANFSETAIRNSTHFSAKEGGDIGFIHSGMLSAPAQEAVDGLSQGEVSSPTRVLEGYALFKLEERSAPRVGDYAEVKDRVFLLYQREQSERQWNEFLSELHSAAKIVMPDDGGSIRAE